MICADALGLWGRSAEVIDAKLGHENLLLACNSGFVGYEQTFAPFLRRSRIPSAAKCRRRDAVHAKKRSQGAHVEERRLPERR